MPTEPDHPSSGERDKPAPPDWLTPSGYVDPVERSIREAIARGEFDHLPGTGKPLSGLDRQYDPDWWARRYLEELKAEDAADEVRRLVRKELPFLKTMPDRTAAASRAAELNALITKVNATQSPDAKIARVDL